MKQYLLQLIFDAVQMMITGIIVETKLQQTEAAHHFS